MNIMNILAGDIDDVVGIPETEPTGLNYLDKKKGEEEMTTSLKAEDVERVLKNSPGSSPSPTPESAPQAKKETASPVSPRKEIRPNEARSDEAEKLAFIAKLVAARKACGEVVGKGAVVPMYKIGTKYRSSEEIKEFTGEEPDPFTQVFVQKKDGEFVEVGEYAYKLYEARGIFGIE